jgi:hypothetical protein
VDCDSGLGREHGGGGHLNEQLKELALEPQLLLANYNILVEGVQEVSERALVLLEHLDQEGEQGPHHRRYLVGLLYKGSDSQHYIVFKLNLFGVSHEFKERLELLLNGRGVSWHKSVKLSDQSNHIPALVDN